MPAARLGTARGRTYPAGPATMSDDSAVVKPYPFVRRPHGLFTACPRAHSQSKPSGSGTASGPLPTQVPSGASSGVPPTQRPSGAFVPNSGT